MQETVVKVQEAQPAEVTGPGGAGGTVSFPDVCKTPAGTAEPVPVPYPDTDRMKDSGAKSVKVEVGGVMTKPGTPMSPTTGDEPGTGGPAGITGRIPGPLKGADPFMVAGLVVALVAIVVVVTGDVGWVERQIQIIPVRELEMEPIGTEIFTKQNYDVQDGGLHTAVTAAIAVLLSLSAVAALIALGSSRKRLLAMVCAGLAAGALVASLAGSWAFDAWAEGEGFNDWGTGSSIMAGMAGSLLVVVLNSITLVRTGFEGLGRPS